MSKNYIKLQNQGNIYQNLMLLNEMLNSVGYADEKGYFTKKAVAEIAIKESMITSAGKMGDDIIDIVNDTEIEEGLNSVLQNAKARMQILRVLGLVSTDYDSELYAITDLGEKLLKRVFPDSNDDIPNFSLLREAFMGISTTSEIYEYYCDLTFNCYLGYEICYALACLDYKIGTSEMPVITTYSIEEIDEYVDTVKEYRFKKQKIPITHEHFPKTQKGEPLKQASNITRSINQILRICDILEKKSISIDGDNYYICTEIGKKYVDAVKKSMQPKSKLTFWTPQKFRKQNLLEQKKICNFGYNNMLDRSGYDVLIAYESALNDGKYMYWWNGKNYDMPEMFFPSTSRLINGHAFILGAIRRTLSPGGAHYVPAVIIDGMVTILNDEYDFAAKQVVADGMNTYILVNDVSGRSNWSLIYKNLQCMDLPNNIVVPEKLRKYYAQNLNDDGATTTLVNLGITAIAVVKNGR